MFPIIRFPSASCNLDLHHASPLHCLFQYSVSNISHWHRNKQLISRNKLCTRQKLLTVKVYSQKRRIKQRKNIIDNRKQPNTSSRRASPHLGQPCAANRSEKRSETPEMVPVHHLVQRTEKAHVNVICHTKPIDRSLILLPSHTTPKVSK